MDTAINREGIDIGVKRVQKIMSEVRFSLFIEFKSIFQVEFRLVEAGDFSSLPGVVDSQLMQGLTLSLAQLQRDKADLLTTFTPEYPKVMQIQCQIDEIEAVLERERTRIAGRIHNDYKAALGREQLLLAALRAQEEQANVVAERSVQYNILKREVETNKQLYEGLLQRLKEAGVSAGLKASNIRIVDSSAPPQEPVRPRPLLNMALAVLMGLGLGVGAAFVQEYLDNTLKTSDDIERFLRVPALALIPSVESMNGRKGRVYGMYGYGRKLLQEQSQKGAPDRDGTQSGPPAWHLIGAGAEQHSTLAEAFRSLRTSVLLSTPDRPRHSIP